MGCVVLIPERDWVSRLRERQEERSPVATQRIISIPKEGLLISPKRVGRPHLPTPMTSDTITLCWLGSLKVHRHFRSLITVTATGLKIIDTPKWAEYSCIGEVLAPQSEQRARVGTQRCNPNPLSSQDRLVRCSLGSLTRAPKHLNPQTLARASPP